MAKEFKTRKVTIAGGTGTLGLHIWEALSRSNRYELRILTRSKSAVPAHNLPGEVYEVDYHSRDSLLSVLKGQDVLVSALAKTALAFQPLLIQTAADAGVDRIIPSEFGADLGHPIVRQFPTYASKVAAQEHLERVRQKSGISYTLIYNSVLLDWGISSQGALLLNPTDRTAKLYDGGEVKFSTTSMTTVGRAVAAALDKFDETENRSLRIHDVVTTQNELLQFAKEGTAGDGGSDWTTSEIDTSSLEKQSWSRFRQLDKSPEVFYGFAVRAAFGEGCGGCFETPDNDFLGLGMLSKTELKEVVKKFACRT